MTLVRLPKLLRVVKVWAVPEALSQTNPEATAQSTRALADNCFDRFMMIAVVSSLDRKSVV